MFGSVSYSYSLYVMTYDNYRMSHLLVMLDVILISVGHNDPRFLDHGLGRLVNELNQWPVL
jgi:hypothetical protein